VERARRLRRGREFDTAFREGTVVSGPLVVLRYRPNEAGLTRWGFAIGKRLAKKATARNRVRRRLREAARQLPVAEGYDIIATARQGALEASYADLRAALSARLARARLLVSEREVVGPLE
jgi:ribonuclease P protein component